MLRSVAFSLCLSPTILALAAQGVPGTPPAQPQQPGVPSQPAAADPNAVPGAPPGFAPGAGGDASLFAKPKFMRISGGVMAGLLLTRVDPVYPDEARTNHIAGAVVMAAHIGDDGRVESLAVIFGPRPLQTAALDAVRQWTYRPYMLNGQPIAVDTTVTVNFNPQ